MIFALFTTGCGDVEPSNTNYSSFIKEDTGYVTPQPEPSEPTTEPQVEEPKTGNILHLNSENISCEELQKYILNFTRMFPGELDPNYPNPNEENLNVSEIMTAEFFEEYHRVVLGDFAVGTDLIRGSFAEPYVDEGIENNSEVDPEIPVNQCHFSVELPTPTEVEMTNISGDEGGSTVKWAFFYPASFVQGNVNCEVKTVSEGRFSCQLETSSGQSEIPSKNLHDVELDVGNQYVWSSNRYLVYIEGNISGSFSDMGFVDGWNIATVNGSEILHVEGLFEDHEPLVIETESLTSRYVVSASGSRSETDNAFALDHEGQYTISLAPLTWIFGDTTANTVNSTIFLEPSNVAWKFYVWGKPEASHFFDGTNISSIFYWQWAEYVDTAVEIPIPWGSGSISYENIDGTISLGDVTVSSDVQPLGATCLESDRVIYIYLDEPNRPSETLWYRLTGAKPGWKAVIGTQGSYQTWRDVVESEFGLTYSGYEVSTTCIMSSMWFW